MSLSAQHQGPFVLCINWPDQPGEDDDRVYGTLEEAREFIQSSIHNAPWTSQRPSFCLTDRDGNVIEES